MGTRKTGKDASVNNLNGSPHTDVKEVMGIFLFSEH